MIHARTKQKHSVFIGPSTYPRDQNSHSSIIKIGNKLTGNFLLPFFEAKLEVGSVEKPLKSRGANQTVLERSASVYSTVFCFGLLSYFWVEMIKNLLATACD